MGAPVSRDRSDGRCVDGCIRVYSLQRLPIDAVPDITPNQVLILTGAEPSPVEVEQFLTFQLRPR